MSSSLSRCPIKIIFTLRASNFDCTSIYRHAQLGVALFTFDDPMINQFEYFAFV